MMTAAANGYAQDKTLAERLGYAKDDVLLIIHADDMGMCHSSSLACIDALEKGIVTCASTMVPCPWFPEIAQYAREHPEADIGLHLTYTAEWKRYRWGPLSPRSLVPGLIDEEGYFHHGVEAVVKSSNAKEIEIETRAQIEHALRNGLKPTHLDSHMGTIYADPSFLQTVLKLSEEYDIPFMFFNPTPAMIERVGGEDKFPSALSESMAARGVPLIDSLPSIGDVPVDQYEEAYKKLIAELKPGVHLLIIHPNLESDESRAITGTHEKRNAEYEIFTNPAMKTFIEKQGVKLIGWKDLLPLWKSRARVE